MADRPDPATPSPTRRPPRERLVAAALLAALLLALWLSFPSAGPAYRSIPYSTLIHDVTAGRVTHATLDDNSWEVRATLRGGAHVVSGFPPNGGEKLTALLVRHHVDTSVTALTSESLGARLAATMVPLLVILGGAWWLISRQGAGVRKFTQGRDRAVEVPVTRFSDVAGEDEAVAELAELVEFLRDPSRFERAGARVPHGILLVGPPGTGKTLLARAVAGEAGVPFYALAGSDFVETFVGVGASRVRAVFARARKAGRAIVFIDEIDAVGKARVQGGFGMTEEREQTLNQLLVEMDGFSQTGIIVLAATNRPDVLDAALTRAGRFDRRIQVPRPDRRGREAILTLVTRSRRLAPSVDLAAVARRTAGLSGADLDYLVNEAALESARRGDEAITPVDFDRAIETQNLGRARTSALVTERDREITAWHEAGHTVVALASPHLPDPVGVSIIPRGEAGGATWLEDTDDHFVTETAFAEQLAVLAGGRAGEHLLLKGEHTQGAASDLLVATRLATQMVTRFGMAPPGTGFGPAVVESALEGDVGLAVRAEVNQLLERAAARAAVALRHHEDLLARVAQRLIEDDTLDAAQIAELRASDPSLPPPPR